MYERGAALSESDAQRFIRKLVIEGYLRESVVETAHHSVIALLQISNKGLSFVNNSNRLKVCIIFYVFFLDLFSFYVFDFRSVFILL